MTNKYKNPVCKGCMVLGSNCGSCEKCQERLASIGIYKPSVDKKNCPHNITKVVDSRSVYVEGIPAVKRARLCKDCKGKITTYEVEKDHIEDFVNKMK